MYFVKVTISLSEFILYLYEIEDKHIASYSYKKLRKHTFSHSISQQTFSEKLECAQNYIKY